MRTLPHGYNGLLDQVTSVANPALAQWIRESLEKGGDPDEMTEAMIAAGIPLDAASTLVHLGRNQLFLGQRVDERLAPRSVMGTPEAVHAQHHLIDVGDRMVRKTMSLGSAEAILYDDLLSDEECEHIKKASTPYLVRSAVVGKNFSNVETRIRTSAGAFLDRAMDPVIDRIEQRIAKLTGFAVNRGEGLQVLHYVDEQEYQPHYDFFEPQNEDEARIMAVPGNRIGTLIMYLNNVEEGGATYFPQLKLAIHPKKGSAIWFAYLKDDGIPDKRTEHAGLPVIGGDKWIATKWIREREFLAANKPMDLRYDAPQAADPGKSAM